MDRLSELSIISILHKAGASRVFAEKKFAGLFAYFTFNGIAHAWKIRPDAFRQNFERDVERELGSETKQKVA